MTERFCAEVLSERKPAVAFDSGSAIPTTRCMACRWARRACRGAAPAPIAAWRRSIAPSSGCAPRARRSCCWSARTTARRRSATASSIEDWLAERGLGSFRRRATSRWRGRGPRRCSTRPTAAGRRCWASSRRFAASRGPTASWSARRCGEGLRRGRRRCRRQHGAAARSQPLRRARQALDGDRRQAGAGRLRPAWRLGPDETRPFLMVNDGRTSGALRRRAAW